MNKLLPIVLFFLSLISTGRGGDANICNRGHNYHQFYCKVDDTYLCENCLPQHVEHISEIEVSRLNHDLKGQDKHILELAQALVKAVGHGNPQERRESHEEVYEKYKTYERRSYRSQFSPSSYLAYMDEANNLRVYNVYDGSSKTIYTNIQEKYLEVIEVRGVVYIVEGLTGLTWKVEITTGKITKLEQSNYRKQFSHLIYHSGYIYGIGDQYKDIAYTACEKYDIANNKWIKIPDLNIARGAASGTVFEDRYIYIFGGVNSNGKAFGSVEYLDTWNEQAGWKEVDIKNVVRSARSHMAVMQITSKHILLFGGAKAGSAMLFDPHSSYKEFKILPDLLMEQYFDVRRSNSCVLKDGKVYAVGQEGSLHGVNIHIYDIQDNTWTMKSFPI